MSRRIRQISLGEFSVLLNIAREIHSGKGEPIPELGEDNWNKVAYALEAPFQYSFGFTPYRGFLKKACILFYLLAKGHLLVNGNKRMACTTLNYFCALNDRALTLDSNQLVELARYTANSDAQDLEGCLRHIADILHVGIKDTPPNSNVRIII